jgi:hypothetical protein
MGKNIAEKSRFMPEYPFYLLTKDVVLLICQLFKGRKMPNRLKNILHLSAQLPALFRVVLLINCNWLAWSRLRQK